MGFLALTTGGLGTVITQTFTHLNMNSDFNSVFSATLSTKVFYLIIILVQHFTVQINILQRTIDFAYIHLNPQLMNKLCFMNKRVKNELPPLSGRGKS